MPNNSTTKPCHNCRRRRLRCDRSWPSCHKCALSGQECLGYGKVFVWTQAIDSQGNPRPSPVSGRRPGETGGFQPQTPAELGGARGDVAISWAVAGAENRDHRQIHDVQDVYSEHGHDERVHSGHSQQQPLALRGAMSGKDIVSTDKTATGMDGSITDSLGPDHQADVPGEAGVLGAGNLTDPLFQDLDRHSRYYLAHCKCLLPLVDLILFFCVFLGLLILWLLPRRWTFTVISSCSTCAYPFVLSYSPALHIPSPSYAPRKPSFHRPWLLSDLLPGDANIIKHPVADRVCKDLVARDSPSSNPFRELIPLTNTHPLLLQILIATSAIHWSNIFQPIVSIPTVGLTDPGGYLAQLRSQDLVSRQALIHALTAKQKAMGHLRQVLDTLDPAGSEVALAAMHFFIKFDLIDLERNDGKGWQAHLEGASSILALLTPDSSRHASSRMLRDCVIADCFM